MSIPGQWNDLLDQFEELKKNLSNAVDENEMLKREIKVLREENETLIDAMEKSTNREGGYEDKSLNSDTKLSYSVDIETPEKASQFDFNKDDRVDIDERNEENGEVDRGDLVAIGDLPNMMGSSRLSNTKKRLSSFIAGAFDLSEVSLDTSQDRNEIYNTETIHMYALTAVKKSATTSSRKYKVWGWIISFITLAIIFIQLVLLFALIVESSAPTCARHTDCNLGRYCKGMVEDDFRQPRCDDCDFQHLTKKCSLLDKEKGWKLKSITEKVWYDGNFTFHSDKFGNTTDLNDYEECVAAQHCQLTRPGGLEEDTCPSLHLTMGKISNDQILVFFFVTILFAASIVNDVQEAAIENSLLDYVIENLGSDIKGPNSLYVLRIANRIRRYMLPFVTCAAGAAIILSDAISTKNIVLNLLAVLFVTEADNLLANLFLSPRLLEDGDDLVQACNLEGAVSYSFWGTRIYGICVCTLMLVCSLLIKPVVSILYGHGGCAYISRTLVFEFCYFFPLINCFFQLIRNVLLKRSLQERAEGLVKFSRLWVATFCILLIFRVTLSAIRKQNNSFHLPAVIISIVVAAIAGIRAHHVLKESNNRSKKHFFIDAIVLLIWLGAQIGTQILFIKKFLNR